MELQSDGRAFAFCCIDRRCDCVGSLFSKKEDTLYPPAAIVASAAFFVAWLRCVPQSCYDPFSDRSLGRPWLVLESIEKSRCILCATTFFYSKEVWANEGATRDQ